MITRYLDSNQGNKKTTESAKHIKESDGILGSAK